LYFNFYNKFCIYLEIFDDYMNDVTCKCKEFTNIIRTNKIWP
jgi:hypothetical protein